MSETKQDSKQTQSYPKSWWKAGVIYQVYVRSFCDTNGDGVGDLKGVLSKLDYFQWLGVDVLWLSPFYPSPQFDMGYDVSDHCNVDPLHGTMEDFDKLLEEVHKRGMKMILDYIPNHTSSEHEWFKESRSSKDNPKRNWYLWYDPKPDGEAPNNWLGIFGGKAWTFDEKTGQYYYHVFTESQPDLNWRNSEVHKPMLDIMRFWLKRGVDGFRIDALNQLIKDDQLRDEKPNPDWDRNTMNDKDSLIPDHTSDQPEVIPLVAKMRAVSDEYPDKLLVGELYLPIKQLMAYYGSNVGNDGVHLPLNLHLINVEWKAEKIKKLIEEYELAVPKNCWPSWVLSNHDVKRISTRVGPEKARIGAVLFLTLRGTPIMYNGDEIGMHDTRIPEDKITDPYEKNEPGRGLGRDPCRTPMQWNDSPNAGFTTGEPWLPVADDYKTFNVESEKKDPKSFLSLYKRLIDVRRSHDALIVGDYEPVGTFGDLFSYLRTRENKRILVVLNFGDKEQEFTPEKPYKGRILLSCLLENEGSSVKSPFKLKPYEGIIVELDS